MASYTPPQDRGYMGDPRRGASLGRPSYSGYRDKAGNWIELELTSNAPPMRLVRVRMSACGAYDAGGAYWGLGDPLYYYENSTGDICGYVRGSTREAAKQAVRESHPAARFFR